MGKRLLSIISFLGYFFVASHLTAMISGMLDIYWIYNLFNNEKLYYVLMAAPFLLLVFHGIAGILNDAQGLKPKTAILTALFASLLLLASQIAMRVQFESYTFFMSDTAWPNKATVTSDPLFQFLWNARVLLVGVLGYSIYSMFVSGASYEYVTITTYYTDTGFEYDQKTSETKHAVWVHLLLGFATTGLLSLLSKTPLIILAILACVILLCKHKNKKALIKKCVALGICGILCATPCFLYDSGFSVENMACLHYSYHYNSDGEFDGYTISGEESSVKSLKIPETYFGRTVVEIGPYAFTEYNYKNLEYIIIPSTIKAIRSTAFQGSSYKIFFEGDYSTWKNNNFPDAHPYYYSETQPIYDGRYWHYADDGKTPIIWERENT